MELLHPLSKLSDDQLLAALEAVASRSHRATAQLVAHIGEVDARGLYRREACSSMFVYCVQRLHLSEAATAKRIQVARAARRFEGLLDYLADGRVHLSGLTLLIPHLPTDRWREVLDRAVYKSKRQIEALVAELAPQPDIPAVMRKLPESALRSTPAPPTLALTPPAAPSPAPRPARSEVRALAPARFKVQFTADQALRDKIEQAQELLRHRIPDGDLAQVFDRALGLLVDKLRAERFGLTKSPRRSSKPPTVSSRYTPAAVKREVYARDDGQCTFVDARGRRCAERGMLEYDHIIAYAHGGLTTVDNLRLRCRAHNQLHAEDVFGRERITQLRLC